MEHDNKNIKGCLIGGVDDEGYNGRQITTSSSESRQGDNAVRSGI